jgi:putative ATP-dependent endonuclease of the OLD family
MGKLDAEQSVLSNLSSSLEVMLKLWANPNASAKVQWKQYPEKSIKVEEPWAHIQIGEN